MSKNWAFMQTFVVPHFDSNDDYLRRLRLVQTPWFGVYLHRIGTPDSRPTLHDHPWNFTSLVLRGGYVETRLNPHTQGTQEKRVTFFNRMRTHDAHAITALLRVPTWTLVFVGRRARTWGYLEPYWPTGWVWTPFNEHPHDHEFQEALARRKVRAS